MIKNKKILPKKHSLYNQVFNFFTLIKIGDNNRFIKWQELFHIYAEKESDCKELINKYINKKQQEFKNKKQNIVISKFSELIYLNKFKYINKNQIHSQIINCCQIDNKREKI